MEKTFRIEPLIIPCAEKTVQAYPNAELVILPGEGHGFSEKALDDIINRSLGFLRTLV